MTEAGETPKESPCRVVLLAGLVSVLGVLPGPLEGRARAEPASPAPGAASSPAPAGSAGGSSPVPAATAGGSSAAPSHADGVAAGVGIAPPLVEDRLRALIPDEAVAHPESWAGAALAADKASPAPEAGAAPVQANPQTTAENAPAPATPEAPPALNPASPLAEPGGFTLPWPGTSVDMSALPPLEQDPALPKAMSEAVTELTAIPLDLPGATSQPAAKVHRAVREPRNPGEAKQAAAKAEKRLPGGRVVLAYPDALQAFPERAAFEARFRELSSVQTPIGKDQDAAAQTAVRAASDRQLLLKLLAYFGYYDGEVNQALATPAQGEGLPQAGGGAITVRFDIQPGAHYRLGSVDLGGLADTGQDYPALRKAFAVQAGDPVSTARILAEVDHLTAALGEAGYPFAKLGAPALSVDHAREQASLSLPVTPGGKYRFGAITSNLPRYLPGRHLVDLARFHAGDTFRRSQMEDLHKAILATGLVSSAGIAPRETSPPKGDAPGQLALDVTMAKAPQHTIAGAIGYDTGEGFRLETSWEKRNIFPPEGSLRLRGVAGTNEQLAGVTVSRANFHGRDRTLSLDLYADNATLTAYAARKVGTALTYQRQTTLLFQKPWSWSVGLEAEASDEREGVPSGVITGRHMYITTALPLRAAFDASDDLLDPTHGGRISLRASPERSWTQGQVSNYVKLQLDAAAFHPLVKGVVEALRVRIGSIIGTGIDQIAPSRRFYAGGGGSIRGFGYELVGPLNSLGEPKGGLSLYEVSAETRVDTGWFGGALALVPFIDIGGVGTRSRPDFSGLRYGAGLGLRYKTGFGPIRLDVGTPLDPRPGESRLGVYVSLGQSF